MSTSTTPAVGPDQPDPIRDIKAALEGREGWHDLSAKVQRKGDTLLIAGLCVTPPAEAQPVGEAGAMPGADGGFTTAAFKAADVPVGTKLYTAPPSAPVGVEGLPPDGAYLIVYDDADQQPEAFALSGARDAALARFEQVSGNWNAHLYAKIKSNTRDCEAPDALAQQPAAVDEDTIEKIALLFTRSGEYFVGDRDECLAKARKAVALAGQQGGRADG